MKKIGIMTFHKAINYGAILQTYALNAFLNKNNFFCETIDYNCDYITNEYKLVKFNLKNIKGSINTAINIFNNISRKSKFNKFTNENIKISTKKYNKNNIHESNKYYDCFITGSDQVWNINLCKDDNYYLPFVSQKEKIAYAASFGNVDIIKDNTKLIEDNLKNFKAVFVREKSAEKELNSKYNIPSVNVVDPTFLLNEEEWGKLVTNDFKGEKYILMYVLHEESAYDIAKKISEEKKIPVYIITQSRKKRINGKYIRNAGPNDFIDLIKNSEYVVTDSFHGTALSIIFRKNLKVVLKKKNVYLNDRLLSILNNFNLNECIVNSESSIKQLICKVKYAKSEELIKMQIDESKKLLLEALRK